MSSLPAIEEGLTLFGNEVVTKVKNLSTVRSSSAEKFLVETDRGQKYFVKRVGPTKCEQVQDLYHRIEGYTLEGVTIPELTCSLNGYLVFRWINGNSFFNILLRNTILHRLRKPFAWMYSLGQWLSAFHKSYIVGYGAQGMQTDEKLSQIAPAVQEHFAEVPVCKTHNDFTLRNVLRVGPNRLCVLDVDAAFHREFPAFMYPYHDMSIFAVNLLSLSKVPFVSMDVLRRFLGMFLIGYFQSAGFAYSHECLIHFVRMHYFGHFMDRSFGEMYKGMLNGRYIRYLGYQLSVSTKVFPTEDEINHSDVVYGRTASAAMPEKKI